MTQARTKISVTMAADLLSGIDREASAAGGNRSAVIERLLRRGVQGEKLARLENSTAEYYDSLTAREKAGDEALAKASGRAARRLSIDRSEKRPGRERSRRAG